MNEVIVVIDRTYTWTKILGVFDSIDKAKKSVENNKMEDYAVSYIKFNINEEDSLTIYESNI